MFQRLMVLQLYFCTDLEIHLHFPVKSIRLFNLPIVTQFSFEAKVLLGGNLFLLTLR